jgi:hypothetical protein
MPYAPSAGLLCWGRRLVCSLLLCYGTLIPSPIHSTPSAVTIAAIETRQSTLYSACMVISLTVN